MCCEDVFTYTIFSKIIYCCNKQAFYLSEVNYFMLWIDGYYCAIKNLRLLL